MEIEYKKVEKVVVHQISKYTIKELIKTRLGAEGARPIFWCDGVVFIPYYFSNDKAKALEMDGIVNMQYFDYAILENYTEIFEFEDSYFKTVKARIINYENIPFYKELVKWVKENENKGLW